MALKITLKPHERMIIGGAVIKNGSSNCELLVENNIPILREKDIMSQDDANTPSKRIYFVIQLMYVDEKNIKTHHEIYWSLVKDILKAAPSALDLIDQINEYIVAGRYYQALKLARQLIKYEQKIINNLCASSENIRRYSEVEHP